MWLYSSFHYPPRLPRKQPVRSVSLHFSRTWTSWHLGDMQLLAPEQPASEWHMGISGAQKKCAVGLFKLSRVLVTSGSSLMVWCIWLWSYLYLLLPRWHWLFWLSSHNLHAVKRTYPPANKSAIMRKKPCKNSLFFFFPWCLGAGLNKLIENSLRQCAARSSLEPC